MFVEPSAIDATGSASVARSRAPRPIVVGGVLATGEDQTTVR
jgi:hypothetical protein